MLKSKSLSTHMSTACRWCRANPEKFTVFIERGGIETTGETPTFVYNYRLVMFVMDYTGDLDDLTLPLIVWLAENQPQLLLNPERNGDIQFTAAINDDDSADVLFEVPLRERVRVTRRDDGTLMTEHLPEPKSRIPQDGDWSHILEDVTWNIVTG